MHASDKVTTYNAYVTGFGATKRIVVWDTTARDLTLPQTLFIFGQRWDTTFSITSISEWLTPPCSCSSDSGSPSASPRPRSPATAKRWQIRALGDWSSLPLLMLLASLLLFSGNRWPTPSAVGKSIRPMSMAWPSPARSRQTLPRLRPRAFQILGEKSYSYPNPSPFLVFWSYSHPPIADRVRLALSIPCATGSLPHPGQK